MISQTAKEKMKIDRKRRYVVKTITNTIVYSPSAYGINNNCTGKNVKIAVLDSGYPTHKDIRMEGDEGDKINLCEKNQSAEDKNGHATMIAGIIKANNRKKIIGNAPHAKLTFGKITNNKGETNFNTVVAGVLWAIVKGVDVIILPLGTNYDYRVLHDAIKKAYNHGISLFAAAGDNEEIEYPACYPEVFSTGFLTKSKSKNDRIKKNIDAYLPNKQLYTTYLNNQYAKISGSSISTAFFAGLGATLIEQYKSEKRKSIPKLVYSKLKEINRRK